ncbi:hypothetical protein DAEQUDRAFT_812508, partial [Daedalea quercina L-15889]
ATRLRSSRTARWYRSVIGSWSPSVWKPVLRWLWVRHTQSCRGRNHAWGVLSPTLARRTRCCDGRYSYSCCDGGCQH